MTSRWARAASNVLRFAVPFLLPALLASPAWPAAFPVQGGSPDTWGTELRTFFSPYYNLTTGAWQPNAITKAASQIATAFKDETNTWTQPQTFNGQIISTLAVGTPPFDIASGNTTKVVDLNADLLDGFSWNNPGVIGDVAAPSIYSSILQQTGLFRHAGYYDFEFADSLTAPNKTIRFTPADIGSAGQFDLSIDYFNGSYSRAGWISRADGTLTWLSPVSLSSTLTVAGSVAAPTILTSTGTCATGFTAVSTPANYCRANSQLSASWSDLTACTARTTGATLPAAAKFVWMSIEWVALSNNATGLRNNYAVFYSGASCSGTFAAFSRHGVFEHVAVAAGTAISYGTDHVLVPLVSTDTFYTTQLNAGGNGNAAVIQVNIEGYYRE